MKAILSAPETRDSEWAGGFSSLILDFPWSAEVLGEGRSSPAHIEAFGGMGIIY